MTAQVSATGGGCWGPGLRETALARPHSGRGGWSAQTDQNSRESPGLGDRHAFQEFCTHWPRGQSTRGPAGSRLALTVPACPPPSTQIRQRTSPGGSCRVPPWKAVLLKVTRSRSRPQRQWNWDPHCRPGSPGLAQSPGRPLPTVAEHLHVSLAEHPTDDRHSPDSRWYGIVIKYQLRNCPVVMVGHRPPEQTALGGGAILGWNPESLYQ